MAAWIIKNSATDPALFLSLNLVDTWTPDVENAGTFRRRKDAAKVAQNLASQGFPHAVAVLKRHALGAEENATADRHCLAFDTYLLMFGRDLPKPEAEFYFNTGSDHRFDRAWPVQRFAVEIDGGRWKAGGGRHATNQDAHKIALAVAKGWRVIRVPTDWLHAEPETVISMVRLALQWDRPLRASLSRRLPDWPPLPTTYFVDETTDLDAVFYGASGQPRTVGDFVDNYVIRDGEFVAKE